MEEVARFGERRLNNITQYNCSDQADQDTDRAAETEEHRNKNSDKFYLTRGKKIGRQMNMGFGGDHATEEVTAVDTAKDQIRHVGHSQDIHESGSHFMNICEQFKHTAVDKENPVGESYTKHISNSSDKFEDTDNPPGESYTKHISNSIDKFLDKIEFKLVGDGQIRRISKSQDTHIGELELKHYDDKDQLKQTGDKQHKHVVDDQCTYVDDGHYQHIGEYYFRNRKTRGKDSDNGNIIGDVACYNKGNTVDKKNTDDNRTLRDWNCRGDGFEDTNEHHQTYLLEHQANCMTIAPSCNTFVDIGTQARCCLLHYPNKYKCTETASGKLKQEQDFLGSQILEGLCFSDENNSDDQKARRKSSMASIKVLAIPQVHPRSDYKTQITSSHSRIDGALLTQKINDISASSYVDFNASLMIRDKNNVNHSLLNNNRREINAPFLITHERKDIDKDLLIQGREMNASTFEGFKIRSYLSHIAQTVTTEDKKHKYQLVRNIKQNINIDRVQEQYYACKIMTNKPSNILTIPSQNDNLQSTGNESNITKDIQPYTFQPWRHYCPNNSHYKTSKSNRENSLKLSLSDPENLSRHQGHHITYSYISKETAKGLHHASGSSTELKDVNLFQDPLRLSNEDLLSRGCVPLIYKMTSVSTEVDPFTAPALSLIHVPHCVSGYGFTHLTNAPHQVQVDELLLHDERLQRKLKYLNRSRNETKAADSAASV